jgi:hypothetical protein
LAAEDIVSKNTDLLIIFQQASEVEMWKSLQMIQQDHRRQQH